MAFPCLFNIYPASRSRTPSFYNHLIFKLIYLNHPMSTLSKPAQQFLDTILKHYPIEGGAHSQGSQPSSKPKMQHLHDYRKEREIYDKPTGEKLQAIQVFKDEGNGHFQHGRYNEASYFYQKAIAYGDYTYPEEKLDEVKLSGLLQKVQCNLGLCLIKMEEWEKAKNHLMEASRGEDPKVREKSKYWLTKYFLRNGKIEESRHLIHVMSQDSTTSPASLEELRLQLSTLQSKTKKIQKKSYQSMFSK